MDSWCVHGPILFNVFFHLTAGVVLLASEDLWFVRTFRNYLNWWLCLTGRHWDEHTAQPGQDKRRTYGTSCYTDRAQALAGRSPVAGHRSSTRRGRSRILRRERESANIKIGLFCWIVSHWLWVNISSPMDTCEGLMDRGCLRGPYTWWTLWPFLLNM